MEETILQIPLQDIFADYEWNSRSITDIQSSSSDGVYDSTGDKTEQGEGIQGLISSIRTSGQDNPVVICPVHAKTSYGGKRTECPYELVAGFRRYTAIVALNLNEELVKNAEKHKDSIIPNVENGKIRAILRNYNKTQAKLFNGRENTERASLKTPDVVALIRDLESGGLKQNVIAEGLGISVGYTHILSTIGTLPKPVLDHWRQGKKFHSLPNNLAWRQLTTQEMWRIAKMKVTEDKATTAYVKALEKEPKKRGPKKREVGNRIRNRIKMIARVCGQLVKNGVLYEGSMNWSEVIGPYKMGFPIDSGNSDREQVIELWKLADDAFKKGLESETGKERDENDTQ